MRSRILSKVSLSMPPVGQGKRVSDGGDIGGMAAHHHDRILHAVQRGQTCLEGAMDRAFAGNHTAGGRARAIGLQGLERRGIDLGMAVQAKIVVGGEIVVLHAVDAGGGAGDAVMRLKEGVLQADHVGGRAVHAQLAKGRKL